VAPLELVERELHRFQIDLPRLQKVALAEYCDELDRWNKKINLTALSGAELVRKLVVEPVWIARKLRLKGALVDIGSGNGSPAIPFQIVCPLSECHLVEARAKRAAFLRHMITTLNLDNIAVHRARFEDITTVLKTPDWISLRAVALSQKLIDSVKEISGPTTTLVWITSSNRPLLHPVLTLSVPITGTQVFLFQLDLS
jgi:16S rRNA (guanine527-N7)-methyltransferase